MNRSICAFIFIIAFALALALPHAHAAKINAADVDKFAVLQRGSFKIVIDANLKDWALDDQILFMGEDTWEALGGSWKGDDDLSAELKILYDEDSLYFGMLVSDDDYVAKGANPWDNDGPQMAIDSSAGKIPAGWPNATTHLYNFSVANGWLQETGPFMGDAEIEMARDDDNEQTIFEWRMPIDIFADRGFKLEPKVEIAFAIIINDSDKDAEGQTGWVGWGNNTIVFGKNPEEMKTLVLEAKAMPVEPKDKLAITWGAIK